MQNILLRRPASNTLQSIPSTPESRLVFDFPAGEAILSRSGDNLVFTFEDGASIHLENFYTVYSKESMPTFQVDGMEISGEQFFAALGEDLMPAAGPAASAARASRYSEYANSSLMDGVGHMDGLDWGMNQAQPEAQNEATIGTLSAADTTSPAGPVVPPPYVLPSNVAGSVTSSDADVANEKGHTVELNLPAGVTLVPGTEYLGAYGNIVVDDEGKAVYTQLRPYEHTGPGADTQPGAENITVKVTLPDGRVADVPVTVDIVDDVPTLTVSDKIDAVTAGHTSNTVTGQITYDFGADDGADKSFTITTKDADGKDVSANYP
ncbi:MAG: hypothetical protein RBR41_14025, partial [Desulfovibrio sp.]|nr:hypothetical protein [Desulfovibrio sp.]